MKKEITPEQIKESEYYKQAVKVAELVAIPELSEDAQNYFDALTQYKEHTRNLNAIYSNRFLDYSMTEFTPDLTEFQTNLEVFRVLEITIAEARTLHEALAQAVKDGLHEQAIKEQAERQEIIRAKHMITANAYTAQLTRLEAMAKTSEQLAKKRAREEAKKA